MKNKTFNILVTDDNKIVLCSIEEYFKKYKNILNVSCFSKSPEAFNSFKSKLNTTQKYDLAIIDLRMPVISGNLLSVMLKSQDKTIKTVLYTGSSQKLFLDNMDCFKFDAVLKKSDGINKLDIIFDILGINNIKT